MEQYTNPKRIVLKVGSSVLTTSEGHFSLATVIHLVEDVIRFCRDGGELILVSSGAIACGMDTLNLSTRPRNLPDLQACAAVGQSKLMKAYEDAFSAKGMHTAQILVTRNSFYDRLRYLNVRNTVNALLRRSIVPIVNENDSVSTDEIRFGDNDMLAALMATAVRPDLLIYFSDVSGLLDQDKGTYIPMIASVKALDEAVKRHVKDTQKKNTVGGMYGKLTAIRVAMQSGVPTVLADGKRRGTFSSVIHRENGGTLFVPSKTQMKARKQWLAHNAKIKGSIAIDSGARKAVVEGHKSLLATGIKRIEGTFSPGDIVSIDDASGNEVARGLVNYSSHELRQIMGKKSGDVRAILKGIFFEEVIHRDNLAVLVEGVE